MGSQTLTATTLDYGYVDENNVIFSGFSYNGFPSDGFNYGTNISYGELAHNKILKKI